MSSDKPIEIPSRRFGRYLLRSRLGSGGMAEVFLADAVDGRGEQVKIALKLMRKATPLEAFHDEADLMGLLSHPNLVQRLEIGEAFGRPFIAMEFLMGGDLRALIEELRRRREAFPTSMAAHVVLEMLKGLSYFHQAKTRTGSPLGLVHGDVNPSNVFFSARGEIKLGDFGVAKSRHANIGPVDGVAAGKLHYLSPEQTRGEPLTAASDLFSVGIVLHELLTGFHPFRGDTSDTLAVMNAIRAAKLSLPEDLDRPLAQILRKALHPGLGVRYRTAGEFAGDLFAYTLDHGLLQSRATVQTWLTKVVGMAV
ncbi:MAG TPA: serine/threonine-protein kinase [Myxococcaceae bacterium]|nr:serine/threonine-protein kinase [Myxococcaceae bacterium]